MSGLLLAGDVFINRYVNGALVGEYGPINATAFSITLPEATTKIRKSSMRDSFGAALDSVVLASGSGKLKIESDDADPDMLAMALLGTVGDASAAGGSISGEVVVAAHDLWRRLAHPGVSSVVVKDVTDTTTYTNGTDYVYDAATGRVKALSSGTIGDGDTLHISYSYAALTSTQILAAQSNEVRCAVSLTGTNLANQKKVEVYIPEAALIPSGDINLVGEDFIKYSLSGDIVLRDGESAPFTYKESV